MGAAIAHSGQQAQPWDHFTAVFHAVWAQSERVSASFRDLRRNMNPLVHTRDLGTIDFTGRRCSEEGGKGYGHRFLRFTVFYTNYLEKGKTVTGLYYAELLGRFDAKFQKKTAPFSEEENAHERIRLRTAVSSTVSSRFNPARLLFVSKLEKVTRRAEIWVEWGGYRRHGGLLYRPPENESFRLVKGVRTSLDQMYRAKMRPCWEINRHFPKF